MSERHESAKSIFLSALEITSAPARQAFIAAACGENRPLFEEVQKLLDHQAQADSFLESPAAGDALAATVDRPDEKQLGRQIGAYKIRELIGEGGMGAVYLAEQERPLRRRVALKVIKPGMDSKAVLGRFEAERNALALMNHPNIAKVLDAGSTQEGHPYFVMELVNGIPITEYCDDQKLPIRERLRLFVDVCSAIQHAHQKGIIHRDIKPSNVLVTELDGKPIAKVIDFGVAKALNQSLTEHSVYTAFQSVIGTPLYMSPEQASFSAVDVDTRSDVYSLGVLLYELLTGTTPFSTEDLKKVAQEEVFRMIREHEPPRPSNRISSLGGTATKISQLRRTVPDELGRSVSGDLDWIVMKALSKERGRRYDSAIRFAEDVQRYLTNDMVEARPPSMGYQLKKFYQRNRSLAVSALIAFILLSSCLIVVTAIGFQLAKKTKELKQKNEQLLSQQHQLELAREEADQRAILLQGTLSQLWEVLADNAMNAAFSGDIEIGQKAIDQAESAGAPADLTGSLRGISLLVAGQPEEAIRQLQAVLEESPESSTANAVLCWAYIQTARYGLHEIYQDKVQQLLRTGSPRNDYERFFVVLSQFIDGDLAQLNDTLVDIDEMISQRRNWGVLYLLRSRVACELAMEERSLKRFEDAIESFEKSYDLLQGSSFALNECLHVLGSAIDLAKDQKADSTRWAERMKELVADLPHAADQSFAWGIAAAYYARHGDPEHAQELEQQLISRLDDGRFPKVAEELAYRKELIPREWYSHLDDTEKQMCVALAIACSSPTKQEQAEIRAIVDRIYSIDQPQAYYAVFLDLPCILGDEEMLKQICQKAKARATFGKDNRWWTRYISHMSETNPNDEELLELAKPFEQHLGMSYHAIALRALLIRDIPKAKQYFGLAAQTGRVTTWYYHNAKAFKKKLDEGWLKDEDLSGELAGTKESQ